MRGSCVVQGLDIHACHACPAVSSGLLIQTGRRFGLRGIVGFICKGLGEVIVGRLSMSVFRRIPHRMACPGLTRMLGPTPEVSAGPQASGRNRICFLHLDSLSPRNPLACRPNAPGLRSISAHRHGVGLCCAFVLRLRVRTSAFLPGDSGDSRRASGRMVSMIQSPPAIVGERGSPPSSTCISVRPAVPSVHPLPFAQKRVVSRWCGPEALAATDYAC